MDETIVENKQCPQCGAAFGVRDVDVEFYKKVSPVVAGQKYLIPTPKLCPDCRRRRRVCFRNERNLYKRPCNFSNKEIISIYSPDKVHKVYDQEIRRSDKRDGITYGVDFDFSKTFDEQFKVLQRAVPRIALFNVNPENSHYCQQAYDNKNCYLCFVVTGCEECMHVSHSNRLNKCFDCTLVQDSETSYECLDSDKIYGCKYCDSCQESNNLLHCSDCI